MLASRAFRRLPNPETFLNPSSTRLSLRRAFLPTEALPRQPRGVSNLAQALQLIRNNARSTVRLSPTGLRKPRHAFVRFNGTRPRPDPTQHLHSPEPSLSLSQRLKKLSKEYGWTALGVYLGLSVLDFPFCFLAVRLLGTERIGRWEHAVIDTFWSVVYAAFPKYRKQHEGAVLESGESLEVDTLPDTNEAETSAEDASKINGASEARPSLLTYTGLWTQLVLAYAVHKSFIFIRVPLTAAVLPKVVKTLRGWGWNIGRKAAKG
jgi:hypothetical protein